MHTHGNRSTAATLVCIHVLLLCPALQKLCTHTTSHKLLLLRLADHHRTNIPRPPASFRSPMGANYSWITYCTSFRAPRANISLPPGLLMQMPFKSSHGNTPRSSMSFRPPHPNVLKIIYVLRITSSKNTPITYVLELAMEQTYTPRSPTSFRSPHPNAPRSPVFQITLEQTYYKTQFFKSLRSTRSHKPRSHMSFTSPRGKHPHITMSFVTSGKNI
ncbi:unnamed protein product [Ectocarpus sp. 4 AP-2014]